MCVAEKKFSLSEILETDPTDLKIVKILACFSYIYIYIYSSEVAGYFIFFIFVCLKDK